MRLRQWPGLSIQLLMAASAEDAGACVIQSVVIHAIEQSARAAGRFMNGLSTELLVFVQVGCRVFFEIGFGDFVQLERFALFGFPVLTHFYFLPATNFSISSRSLMKPLHVALGGSCGVLRQPGRRAPHPPGTGRYCRLPDGRVENEWHLYRTERLDND